MDAWRGGWVEDGWMSGCMTEQVHLISFPVLGFKVKPCFH